MDIETYREYCLSKKGVTEGFPFDEDTLVFKVMGKMFSLSSISSIPFRVNLKCDPERAIQLRMDYFSIIEGFHMNKKHWNTVRMNQGDISFEMAKELIDHSYDLVVAGLTKKLKEELSSLEN